jgi:hypothetical protein
MLLPADSRPRKYYGKIAGRHGTEMYELSVLTLTAAPQTSGNPIVDEHSAPGCVKEPNGERNIPRKHASAIAQSLT